MSNIKISERAYRLLQNQQGILNAMLAALREAYEVPEGSQLSQDGREFIVPSKKPEVIKGEVME